MVSRTSQILGAFVGPGKGAVRIVLGFRNIPVRNIFFKVLFGFAAQRSPWLRSGSVSCEAARLPRLGEEVDTMSRISVGGCLDRIDN
jgi:hypothetical protein